MEKKYFQLDDGKGNIVKGDVYSNGGVNQPLIIVSHGFKAFREWGFFPYLAEALASANIMAINIDFSRNGIINPSEGIFDVDIFRTITVTQEIADLNFVLDSIPQILGNNALQNWNQEIYLLGHSLGGAVSIITASKRNDITKIVTWGSIGNIDRDTDRQKENWRAKGVLEFDNRITGQTLLLDVEYLEDKLRNKSDYDLEKCASMLQIPFLIVHGEKDFTVRVQEAEALHKASPHSQLKIIDKASHTFNCRHQFTDTNEILEETISYTIQFLKA
jgi:pimeloyl-ACP methyl ester carboxylesterase